MELKNNKISQSGTTAGAREFAPSTKPSNLDERMVNMSGLQTKGVHAWFGNHHVLEDVSLDFPANTVTGLIGPSGCGKSTFLRMLNRMHEFRLHLRGAITNGVTKAEIQDALIQLAIYAGIPAGVESFRIARKVLIEEGFLNSLRDPEVVAVASKYGDPVELLEQFPT